MFSIQHGSDSFSIIDCCLPMVAREAIVDFLKGQKANKGITRFISTHPDQDHLFGLEHLYGEIAIDNFYCAENKTRKLLETDDFKFYRNLRDSGKAFYLTRGCTRKWFNEGDDERGPAGLHVIWPDTENEAYQAALKTAAAPAGNANNISIILQYIGPNNARYVWMGDLETDFMKKIEYDVNWPEVDVLFAPHHGRGSGKIPHSVLKKMNPKIIVIGSAPSQHLNYYAGYNTITQNSAGGIAFENTGSLINIYVSSNTYSVDFLTSYVGGTYGNYLGTLFV